MTGVFSKYKITASFVDVLNGDPETTESAITEKTKVNNAFINFLFF